MKFKKYIPIILCMLSVLIFLEGCSQKKIDMNYLKTPDQIILNANTNKDEISNIQNSIKQLKDSGTNPQKLQELKDRLFALVNSSSLEINDKDFINWFISTLKTSKATLKNSLDEESQNLMKKKERYDIQFTYNDPQNQTIESIGKGYIPNFVVLNNGTAIIPYVASSSMANNKVKSIIINISSGDMKYIKDYYDTHK